MDAEGVLLLAPPKIDLDEVDDDTAPPPNTNPGLLAPLPPNKFWVEEGADPPKMEEGAGDEVSEDPEKMDPTGLASSAGFSVSVSCSSSTSGSSSSSSGSSLSSISSRMSSLP